MNNTNYPQIISVLKCWKELDHQPLVGLLSDDFTYESTWVINPITGKENFIDFIEKKFRSVKDAVEKNETSLSFQLVQIEEFEDQYFIKVKQITKCIQYEFLISVLDKDGLINKIIILPAHDGFTLKTVSDMLVE